ncbi:MAG: ribosome-associated translation inhibitor RaiA [Leptospirales bacterium]|nr:ribosome-associated translation inhibitor RaiA [Leptospirales bacterium]
MAIETIDTATPAGAHAAMDIQFHFQGMEPTDALKEYTRKKIEKLSAHFEKLFSAVVHFKVERINQIVEFVIDADGEKFVASEANSDMYAAIDLAEDKLAKQIRRHKDKALGRRHRDG